MACVNCEVTRENFNPFWMTEDNTEKLCLTCSGIVMLIKKYSNSSRQRYVNDLSYYLSGITPLDLGNRILFVPKEMEHYINPDIFLMKKSTKLGLSNTKYTGRSELRELSDQILESLISDFRQLIMKNPIGYLISLHAMLEYNIYITMVSIAFYGDGNVDTGPVDDFGNLLIRSLKIWRIQSSEKFNHIYKLWENCFALDKMAFQLAIEICSDVLSKDKKIIADELELDELIGLIRAMTWMITIRDEASNKLLAEQEITITASGKIEINRPNNFDQKYDQYHKELFLSRESKIPYDIPNDIQVKIDEICVTSLGISTKELLKLSSDLLYISQHPDVFLIGSIEFFCELFKGILGKTDEVIRSFIEGYLVRDFEKTESYTDVKVERYNRTLRKCLTPLLDDIYVCPINTLCFAINRLYIDLYSRSIRLQNDLLARELESLHKELDIEFEVTVSRFLVNNISNQVVHSVPEKIRKYQSKEFIFLPGELDVVMLYRDKLFVIECKNLPLRFTAQGIGNEYGTLKKKGKGSYVYKLKNKIEFVSMHWESILCYMGVDPTTIRKPQPIGLFVTRDFTLASIDHDLDFPIISINRLIEWIRSSE